MGWKQQEAAGSCSHDHELAHDDHDQLVLSSPFLAQFHSDIFRISMALASQAVLWRTLSSDSFIDPWPQAFNLVVGNTFWLLATMALLTSLFIYLLKAIFHFSLIKDEFTDGWRVNYLFAPWIAAILLLQCLLPNFSDYNYDRSVINGPPVAVIFLQNWGISGLRSESTRACWCAFTAPILLLEIKLYGQWFTKGKRFLSLVANPSTHLSLIANFVAAQTAARLLWFEPGLFLFAVGIIHYVVVFVTLYQSLPCNATYPVQLRPATFLSIAAPSVACVAWESISGNFDSGCKMLHFLSLFLFTLLVVRPALYVKAMKRFNITWWAYVFPISMLALSSAEYAVEVRSELANWLRRVISMISLVMTIGLIVLTTAHAKSIFANSGIDAFDMKNQHVVLSPSPMLPITVSSTSPRYEHEAIISMHHNGPIALSIL